MTDTAVLLLTLSTEQATAYRRILRVAAMELARRMPSEGSTQRGKGCQARREERTLLQALAWGLADLHRLIPAPPTAPPTAPEGEA